MILPPKRPRPAKPTPLEKLLAEPVYKEIPITVVQHGQVLPLGVMVRGTMQWLLDKQMLETLFQQHAPDQYTRELTMDALVNLFIQVSTGARPSVHAAYKADQAADDPTIDTTYQALYGKLGRLQPAVSEAVVRYSAERCGQLLAPNLTARNEPLPGYRMRVLDGNVLTGTDHRLKGLRRWFNACLPGKSLVIYEPGLGLVTDLVLEEDAYTQERVLLTQIVPRLQAKDLVVADRNFCTTRFVFGVAGQKAFTIVRQHRVNLPCTPISKLKKCGESDTGTVYEQKVQVTDPDSGVVLTLRRIEVRLLQKTRDGDRTIALLTNLPEKVSALQIAAIYRERWTIEKHFQFLTQSLNCEVSGLGQPRAALFAFAMALVAANALAVVRGTLRSVHGVEAEAEISGYYLADEVAGDYRTLMKYLPAEEWLGWKSLPILAMAKLLCALAQHVRLKGLTRSQRGPKNPPKDKPVYNKKHKHYSTARLLQELQQENSC
jgi:Transposase DDE domain